MVDLSRCFHCGRTGTLTSLSAGNRCVYEDDCEQARQEVLAQVAVLAGRDDSGAEVRGMSVSRQINPPCESCGTETLLCSDHSGGWEECPSCGHMQNVRRTPGGEPGRLTRSTAPETEQGDSEDRITRERRQLAEIEALLREGGWDGDDVVAGVKGLIAYAETLRLAGREDSTADTSERARDGDEGRR